MADVYSLGVVLYKLLTGHLPYKLSNAAMHEIARVISEEDEPTRTSDIVATTEETVTPQTVSEVRECDLGQLRKRLAGDLDGIVLTALQKEPIRRYSSVKAFGDDLEKHLENRPAAARWDGGERVPGNARPAATIFHSFAFLTLTFGAGVLFLRVWRVHRRFGLRGQLVVLFGIPVYLAL